MANLTTTITLSAVDKVSATVKSIGKSFDSLNKSIKNVSSNFFNVKSASSDFGSRLRNISLVATAAGGALFALAKSQGQYAEMLEQTSQKTGFSTQSLQQWQFIAKLNNIELSDMVIGMRGLSRTMAEAVSNPKSDMAKWFKRNGIAIDDGHKKLLPLEQVIGNISEVFSKAPNGPAKMATAVKLLSRAGVNMIPILNLGKEKIAELMEEARKYGFQLTDKMIKQQTEFDDNVDRLEWSISQLKMSIGSKLIPMFDPLVTKMRNWINVNRELIATKFVSVAKEFGAGLMMVGKALYAVGLVLKPFVDAMGGLRTVIAAVAGVYIGGLILSFAKLVVALTKAVDAVLIFNGALLLNPVGFLIAAVALAGFAIYKLITQFDEIKKAWIALWPSLAPYVEPFLNIITLGMYSVVKNIVANWGQISSTISSVMGTLSSLISTGLDAAAGFFKTFVSNVVSFFSPLISVIQTVVGAVLRVKEAITGITSKTINVQTSAAAGTPAANTGASPAPLKTAAITQPNMGALAANQSTQTRLDVNMKIDSEGRAKEVKAKSSQPLNFAANTGMMI